MQLEEFRLKVRNLHVNRYAERVDQILAYLLMNEVEEPCHYPGVEGQEPEVNLRKS